MVTDADAARQAAAKLAGPGGKVALKAQVHTGGRGKAGGIKLASSPDEAKELAGQILGMDIRGHTVRRLLVVPAVDIATRVLSRHHPRPRRPRRDADGQRRGRRRYRRGRPRDGRRRSSSITADPALGLHDYQAREVAFALGIEPALVGGFVAIAKSLYTAFVASDASLAEINPLILTKDDRWLALDSQGQPRRQRPPPPPGVRSDARHGRGERDRAAGQGERHLVRQAGRQHRLRRQWRRAGDGDDGRLQALRRRAGQLPRCRRRRKRRAGDAGAGAGPRRPGVKAIFFNIFGGITRCDVVARGILAALEQIQVNVPMVIRLVGTNQEEGRQILAEAGITALDTMEEPPEQPSRRGGRVSWIRGRSETCLQARGQRVATRCVDQDLRLRSCTNALMN